MRLTIILGLSIFIVTLAVTVAHAGRNTGLLSDHASISGRVYYSDKAAPVSGTRVYIEQLSGKPMPYKPVVIGNDPAYLEPPHVPVGTDGKYSFTGLSRGAYRLRARAPGYAIRYYKGTPSPDEATVITVYKRQEIDNIDFVLEKFGSISGHVYYADSVTPAEGTWVGALPLEKNQGYTVRAGIDGSYAIGWLLGKYRVQATYFYQVKAITQYYPKTDNINVAMAVPVYSNQDTGGIDFVLPFSPPAPPVQHGEADFGYISGRVFYADGKTPLNNVWIEAQAAEGTDQPDAVWTDSTGNYLYKVLAGKYKLKATYNTGMRQILQYYPGSKNAMQAIRVEVAAQTTTTDINFTLPYHNDSQLGSISGRLYRADGSPLAGEWVGVISEDGFQYPNVQTNADGSYTIGKLQPGKYVLRFATYRQGAIVEPIIIYKRSPDESGATLIDVPISGHITGIDIVVP